ncbi:MAG: CvpA family protein [Acidobacteriota bacterium]|nr:CvpA family protein [Acidobacteriota bacterium]
MTLVDWIIVALLAGAVLGGLAQGFLRSVFSLGGLILGLVLAAWNYQRIGTVLRHAVHNEKAANAIGFLLIALVVMAVAAMTGSLLSKALHKIGLGCLDRLAGALFGLFQGAVIVTLGILVTVAFFPKTQWLTESRLPKYFFGACHLSTHLSPDKLAQRVRQELKTLEEASPEWMHPGKSGA